MTPLARIAIVAAVVVVAGAGLYFAVGAPSVRGDVSEALVPPPTDDERFHHPDVKPAAEGPYPKIEVDKAKHDFGTVALGRSDSHTFTIKNVGEAPLLLGEPITTCKCTAPKAGEGKIAPGETTTVTLTYTPTKAAREFAQRAYLHTNDPEQPRLDLEVYGRVEELLKPVPGSTIDFGAVTGKEPVTQSVKVLSRIEEDVVVTETETTSDYLKVTTRPIDLNAPMTPKGPDAPSDDEEGEGEDVPETPADFGYVGGVEVVVEILPGMTVGRFKERVTVNFDEEAPDYERLTAANKPIVDYSKLVLEVVGMVKGPFTFVPVQKKDQRFISAALALDLGTFSAAEGTTGTLQLFADGMDEPLELTDVDSSEDYVKLKVRRDPSYPVESGRQKLFLDFVVPPGSPPATHIRKGKVTVTVKTNHPDARELQFYIEMASYAG